MQENRRDDFADMDAITKSTSQPMNLGLSAQSGRVPSSASSLSERPLSDTSCEEKQIVHNEYLNLDSFSLPTSPPLTVSGTPRELSGAVMKTRHQIGQVSAQEVTQEAKRKHRAYIQTNLITAYIDDMRRRHAQAVAKIDIATEAKKESDEVLRVCRAKRESADKVVQAKTNEVTILTDHLAIFSSDYQRRHSGIGLERDKLDLV
ncbi:hypothetical protein FPSE5266_20277 [Fusarium pseudograminearum]|nr:hypothetical protein FPSE5266_20277 [Fusarium pseudograminearum]